MNDIQPTLRFNPPAQYKWQVKLMFLRSFIAVCCGLLGLISFACAESPGDLKALEETKKVESALAALLPGVTPEAIAPAPVPGLYEVIIGSQIYYMTSDGRFLIQGDVVDVATRTNITAARRDTARAAVINGVGEQNMVVFAPKKVAHTITVFTDLDCGYCRKLHKEIDQFEAKGIKVRYLFFPRTGPNTPSYYKAVSVWCSDDRNQALTDAKLGKAIPQKQCDNPVLEQFHLGEQLGVRGTPSIVLEDGRMIPGYVSAGRMAELLDGKVAAAN